MCLCLSQNPGSRVMNELGMLPESKEVGEWVGVCKLFDSFGFPKSFIGGKFPNRSKSKEYNMGSHPTFKGI